MRWVELGRRHGRLGLAAELGLERYEVAFREGRSCYFNANLRKHCALRIETDTAALCLWSVGRVIRKTAAVACESLPLFPNCSRNAFASSAVTIVSIEGAA